MARFFSPASSACTASKNISCTPGGLSTGRRSSNGSDITEGPRPSSSLSKSKSNCRRMGSTIAPRCRKASLDPVRTRDASSSGFAMPATAFIATIECRIDASGTASSRNTRKVRN